MYELVKISDCCYYIDCPVKISIYTAGGENVWLIDSGNDKSAGKKVKQILDTLDMVEDMEAAVFVPSHAEVSPDIRELVRFNREKVYEIAEKVLSVCEEPLNFETVLQKIFQGYGLVMNFEQYALVGCVIGYYCFFIKLSVSFIAFSPPEGVKPWASSG